MLFEKVTLSINKNSTIESLILNLESKFPSLKLLKGNYILAHNQTYLTKDSSTITFQSHDEVAVIPPISGG